MKLEDLKVSMYVRYKRGSNGYGIEPPARIAKAIERINDSDILKLDNNQSILESDVIKASDKLIDLVCEGDYVNGKEVIEIYQAGNKFKGSSMYSFREKTIELDNDNYETIPTDCLFTNEEIKSIVTKEQFDQMSYKVEK